jgi:predicted SAM-dependent methyltransferase
MKLTLNVGCGDRTFDEYPAGYKCINYDERANLKKVDEVGDARDLSRFPDGYFDYVFASDIIEHFPISETNKILTEWKRVLIVGGVIEFRLPDLHAICKKYVEGKHDAKLTSWLLYGAQTYPGNFHYTAFDRKWLSGILKQNGFDVLEVKDSGNNFIIKARKNE